MDATFQSMNTGITLAILPTKIRSAGSKSMRHLKRGNANGQKDVSESLWHRRWILAARIQFMTSLYRNIYRRKGWRVPRNQRLRRDIQRIRAAATQASKTQSHKSPPPRLRVIAARALDAPVLQADDDAPLKQAARAAIYLDEVAVAEDLREDGFEIRRIVDVKSDFGPLPTETCHLVPLGDCKRPVEISLFAVDRHASASQGNRKVPIPRGGGAGQVGPIDRHPLTGFDRSSHTIYWDNTTRGD